MGNNDSKVLQIAEDLNEVMYKLYSKGMRMIAPHEEIARGRLLKREVELCKEFKNALFEYYGGMEKFINSNLEKLDGVYPRENDKGGFVHSAAGFISEDFRTAANLSLEFTVSKEMHPFSFYSSNLKSALKTIVLFPEEFEGIDSEEARIHRNNISIVTTDIVNGEYHVCFSQVPGTYGQYPMNNIELLADLMKKELLENSASPLPVNFYLHIPPECLYGNKEMFMKVEMDEGEYGYENPAFIDLEIIPAGLVKSFVENYKPGKSDAPYGDNTASCDTYRRNKINAIEEIHFQ